MGADHCDVDSEAESRLPATLTAFLLVSSLFLVAQLGTVYWVTTTQEVETEEAAPTETTPGENGDDRDRDDRRDHTGRRHGRCRRGQGGLHVGRLRRLPYACRRRRDGDRGPNLDEAKPPYDLVVTRVTNGMGAMPPFKGQLSDKQIQDVAAYVSSVAGKS